MEEEKSNTTLQQSGSVHLTKPIRCIVKLGGAAITCKNELETINEENLKTVSSQLRQSMIAGSSSGKVIGMDWSRKAGEPEISSTVDDFEDQPVAESSPFIVVHGAGSFGHFQASKSGVHKGGWNRPLVKAGFVATRISVTNLNLEIVRALAREGIPSIGMSPFACGWSTRERNIASADLSAVAKAIESGLVPVLHGDAVLDDLLDCTILSGDVIISHLAAHLKPDYVVFLVSIIRKRNFHALFWNLTYRMHIFIVDTLAILDACFLLNCEFKTDVLGVYDRPPSEPNAILLREIAVAEDGSWSVVRPTLEDMKNQVKTSVAAHDTTGGMLTKIAEAAMIAKLGINVYIVKAATSHALRALSGELKGEIPDDWLGTLIRFSSK